MFVTGRKKCIQEERGYTYNPFVPKELRGLLVVLAPVSEFTNALFGSCLPKAGLKTVTECNPWNAGQKQNLKCSGWTAAHSGPHEITLILCSSAARVPRSSSGAHLSCQPVCFLEPPEHHSATEVRQDTTLLGSHRVVTYCFLRTVFQGAS